MFILGGIVIISIVAFIIINLANMETQTKTSIKDFFINLGSIVALYTVVISLLNLLFTVINKAYPQITGGYNYLGSGSISVPVAILIIFFPIFVLLMWLLEKGYLTEPEKRHIIVKRWLTYITLFFTGIAMAVDLVTILYYFIDGQELTMAFVMKVLVVFAVALGVFMYYISEIREKLTNKSRKIWLIVVVLVILASIIWGFAVLGSPRTQRLYKYDEQKVNDLMSISNEINNYYSTNGTLPKTLSDIPQNYYVPLVDSQTQKPYEYKNIKETTYNLCAEFNKELKGNSTWNVIGNQWQHPIGQYCFTQTINPNLYFKPLPVR
ncbi:MAG: DUF5671 domain-containing protein [bacterium]